MALWREKLFSWMMRNAASAMEFFRLPTNRVVELGSQSAAAEHLDLSRPVVSRYLAELEDWVGARLMHRTTRKLSLTAAGLEILPRCRQMLDLSGDMQAAVSTSDDAPRGMLRISASTSFGQAQLAAAMTEFVVRYPGVSVDLQMLDRTVNLVDERIDLAIRMSNDLDPNLIARRLTVCRSVICASPGYLREHPTPQRVDLLIGSSSKLLSALITATSYRPHGRQVNRFESVQAVENRPMLS